MFEQRHIAFFTATILEWKHLLKPDKYKEVILDSLRFLVEKKRIIVYGFVIMPNHIHLLWKTYSSACFYFENKDNYGFLTHYRD